MDRNERRSERGRRVGLVIKSNSAGFNIRRRGPLLVVVAATLVIAGIAVGFAGTFNKKQTSTSAELLIGDEVLSAEAEPPKSTALATTGTFPLPDEVCTASGDSLQVAPAVLDAPCAVPSVDCDSSNTQLGCSSTSTEADVLTVGPQPTIANGTAIASTATDSPKSAPSQPPVAETDAGEPSEGSESSALTRVPVRVSTTVSTSTSTKALVPTSPAVSGSGSVPWSGSGAVPCATSTVVSAIDSYSPPSMRRQAAQSFSSLAALQSAIDAKSDHGGAVLQLAAGRYNFSGSGISIANKKNLTVYSDPSNRAVLDGKNSANFGVNVQETSGGGTKNVSVIGFEITRTKFHGVFVGSDSDNVRAGSDIYIGGNYVHNVANEAGAGITVRNATSSGRVVVEGNEVTRVDDGGTGSGRGEGIYIGQGQDASHFARNVVIRGNYLHDIQGEAIDIKRFSRDIAVEYNRIRNISVFSQGAITMSLDNLRPQSDAADITIRRNVIGDVRSLGFDGNAIVVGADSLIEENLIFGIAKNPIDVYNDANGPDKVTTIRNNIIQDFGGVAIRENVGSGNRGPSNPFTINKNNNGPC